MNGILLRIYRLPWYLSLILLLSFSYLIVLVFSLFPFPYEEYTPRYGFTGMLLFASVTVPLVETFIFQYLPYQFFEKSFRKKFC